MICRSTTFSYSRTTTRTPIARSKLTRLWQAQTDALDMVPNVGMAATSDVGDLNEIHAGKKEIVARRLAKIALRQTYGRSDIICAAPRYLSHTVDGEKIRVKFRDVGGGLVSSDGKPLTWFQIAGEDSPVRRCESGNRRRHSCCQPD